MDFPWDPKLDKRFKRHQERELKEAYRFATLLGLILFPWFSILDWFTQRDQFVALSWIRYSITTLFLCAHLLARQKTFPGGVFLASSVLLYLSGAAITSMCVVMDGYRSTYYAGVNLVILAVVMVLPGRFRAALGTVVAILVTYFGAVLWRADFRIYEPSLLINNAAFLLATAIIGLSCAKMLEKLKRESFLRLVQAKEFNSVRAAHDLASEALQARDEFISIASHELKTPITSMKLQNDLLKRQIARNESGKEQAFLSSQKLGEFLERNDSQLLRLMRLVDDMLDISRINSGRLKMEPDQMNVSQAIRDILDRLSPQLAAAGMKITTRLDPSAEGHWDRMRIEQVLINLITNAVKYAPNSALHIASKRANEVIVISVSDRGKGIALQDLDRIFNRFERATPATGVSGLGLGLYICRKIIEGHGGRIFVESKLGEGTTFRVELPMMPQVSLTDMSGLTSSGETAVGSRPKDAISIR